MDVRHGKVLRGVALWLLGAGLTLAQAQGIMIAGSTPGQFSVNESGAATYRIPIQVPPGVAGMEPKLELAYNSQSGNGLLGMGWSLSGLSTIGRCPRTMAVDGFRGAVNFDMNDRYCMDGQRLILVSGTYGVAGSEYRTEMDGFSKIVAAGAAGNGVASFLVQTKAGLTMEYGNTADSRIEAQGKTTVRVWAINKISDVKTNFMTFRYIEDNINGDFYPDRIDYSGNASAGLAVSQSVQLGYEARPDSIALYSAGSLLRLTQRLKTVKLMSSGSTENREFRLNYLVDESGRSAITELAECVIPSNNCKKPIGFASLPAAYGVSGPVTVAGAWNRENLNVFSGDFNGDGKSDLFRQASTAWGGHAFVYFSNGDGSFDIADLGTGWDSESVSVAFGDFNGDGKTDVFRYTAAGWGGVGAVHLSNGNGSFTQISLGTGWNREEMSVTTGDFNGDGKTDLFRNGSSNWGGAASVYLSNGDGTFSANSIGTGWNREAVNVTTGDFNGDGKTDLFQQFVAGWSGHGCLQLSNGDGTFRSIDLGAGWDRDATKVIAGDFNGDGITDLIRQSVAGWGGHAYVYFFKGDGSYTYSDMGPGWDVEGSTLFAADFNGDGRTDLFRHAVGGWGGYGYVYLSNGDGTFSPITIGVGWNSEAMSVLPLDFNGDGKSDLFRNAIAGWGGAGQLYSSTPAFAVPSQLASIRDGLTTLMNVVHKPLTSAAVYTKDEPPNAVLYPKVDLQYPQYVVSEIANNNGIGGTTTTQYNYGGLKAEQGTGRGMLGFRWMKSRNLANNIESYTEFNQNWPFTGTVFKSETRLAGSGNAGVLKRTSNSYAQAAGSATGSTFVYPNQSVEESWDLSGAAYPTVTNAYQYGQSPQYGDPTQISVINSAGAGKTTVNEYWPVNTGSGNWILGRLKKATVTSVTP